MSNINLVKPNSRRHQHHQSTLGLDQMKPVQFAPVPTNQMRPPPPPLPPRIPLRLHEGPPINDLPPPPPPVFVTSKAPQVPQDSILGESDTESSKSSSCLTPPEMDCPILAPATATDDMSLPVSDICSGPDVQNSSSFSDSITTSEEDDHEDSSDWSDDDDLLSKKINIRIKPVTQMAPSSKVGATEDELRAVIGTWKSMRNINLIKANSRRAQNQIRNNNNNTDHDNHNHCSTIQFDPIEPIRFTFCNDGPQTPPPPPPLPPRLQEQRRPHEQISQLTNQSDP